MDKTDNLSQKIKYGIKWQAIFSIASQILYFINGVILARILGPKEFGVYGMVQVVSSFVWMFWQLGLNAAIVQRKDIDEKHLHTAFTISMIMGCLCFLATWISAPLIATFFRESQVITLTRLIAFTFVIYAFDRVPSALLSRNLKFKEAAVPGIVNAILYPVVAIPLASIGFGAQSFVLGVITGAIGMVIVRYYWLLRYFTWRPKFMIDKKSAKELLGFGIFLTLTNILNFFLWNLQKIVTGRYLGAIDLGYLNRAANLSAMPLQKLHTTVGNVLLPAFSKIQDDINKIRDWFRKMNFFSYTLAAPFLIFFIFFHDCFIATIFGTKWMPAAKLLIFTSFNTLLGIPNFYWINIINSKGLPYMVFYMNLVRLPIFLTCLFIGVKFGIKGVVIALSVDAILKLIFTLFILRKYIGLYVKDFIISIFEPVGISLLFAIALLCLQHSLLLDIPYWKQLVVVSVVFFTLLFIYYFYRWKYNSYINYLNLDIKTIFRHK